MAEITKTQAQIETENRPNITDIEGVGPESQSPEASLSQTGVVNPVLEPLTVTGDDNRMDELPRPFSAADSNSSGRSFNFPTAAETISSLNPDGVDSVSEAVKGLAA